MLFKKKMIIVLISILIALTIIGIVCCCNYEDNKNDNTQANIDFIINDTLSDGNNQKVKIFLLAGQSNASGIASENILKDKISEDDYNKYKVGYDNVYINYYNDNGNNKSLGFTNVKLGQGFDSEYFGPELGMGERLSELYKDETIFIIKYTWSATNLHTQWNCEYGNVYKAFIQFVRESMEYLRSKNYDAEIVSMMWMQGESDSNKSNATKYYKNLVNMIKSTRSDLAKYIVNKGMFFVDAYISNSPYWSSYKIVNAAKKKVCDLNELNLCIDTIKEGLTYNKEPVDNPDLCHYDSLSELKLGHLFIETYDFASK